MGSSEKSEEVVGDQRMATISGLAAATVYGYEVAGITSADTGTYSGPMTTLTQGIYSFCGCMELMLLSSFSEGSSGDARFSGCLLSCHIMDQLRSSGGQI